MPTQMTDQEILQKAIEKAVSNGAPFHHSLAAMREDGLSDINLMARAHYQIIFSHDFAKAFWGEERYSYCFVRFIDGTQGWNWWSQSKIDNEAERKWAQPWGLSHATQIPDVDWGGYLSFPEWELRLQQMVLDKEPLKYLEKYL